MGIGLSIEITIPASVDREALLRIGREYSPSDLNNEELTVEEAVEVAFQHSEAISVLELLGVEWHVAQTGTTITKEASA